jgi:2-keto-4-pentenoate hydratase/2-oxohepta-3-ene-1,7-dioic acid hydratase in catechol pathway
MLFSVNQLISYISNYFTLKTGDLLFTGTPAGVGPVAVGDLLEGYIENRRVLSCQCK